ncbi:MAG: 23S rRNA (guanosine(2251)-2'-O)-methyltransferase RlmB [Deltaproteobacteria bacterium]|nr:23S rRNA (guanosine(2251)-2'-O)-methyltransferase RlmB [Deltaproteobacteria bacterium]
MSKIRHGDTGRTLIYGVHPVVENIKAGHRKVYEIFLAKGSEAEKRLGPEFERLKLSIRHLSGIELDSLTRDVKNQGIAARVEPFPYNDFETNLLELDKKERFTVLILDQVQDPNNLGNILRSACCFGVDLVVLLKDRAVSVTSSVEKASAGASAHVRICMVTNLSRSIEALKRIGCWVYGADAQNGVNYFEADLAPKIVFVMGTEGAGLRRLVRENCDVMIKVPITGAIESLNVSNATSILLAEVFRQSLSIKSKGRGQHNS